MSYEICSATSEDVDELSRMRVALQEHLHKSNASLFAMSEAATSSLSSQYLSYLKDPDVQVVVTRKEQSRLLCGMAVGRVIIREDTDPGRFGRIDDVWVDQEYRRKGICRRMVNQLLQHFEERSVQSIVLEYIVGNRESETIWHQFGFCPVITTAVANLSMVRERVT